MPTALAFDLTRLITRIRHASPTGIDRVDLAYARRYLGGAGLAGNGPRFGLVSSPFGPRIVDRDTALGIVEAVAAGWIEDVRAEDDPVYVRTAARLGAQTGETVPTDAGKPAASRAEALRRIRLQIASLLRMVPAGGPERLPPGTIYLHTSHLRLDRPGRFDWLYTRPDVKPVFFVHDLIPIHHPEFGRRGEAARHSMRMTSVARHARHVVVNSGQVGERFSEHIAAQGFGPRPVTAAWLGVEPVFLERSPAPRFERPVFLVCGTIEARKNHLLLLNIWRNLAARLGPDTPRLVIVGRRGWEAENVFDMLDRGHLHDSVMEVRGLTTPGLARLMRGATALLMPSFIEGYGLPVVEAAASGLPVVASDIAVHREIGGAFAHLLDPLDGPGWTEAVEALSRPDSPLRADLVARLTRVAPPTWERHFERVDAVLDDLGRAGLVSLPPELARVPADE